MVPEFAICWAQGQPPERDRYKLAGGRPSWMPNYSYNVFMDSIEVEGYAATMQKHFLVDSPQYQTLCSWIGFKSWKHNWWKMIDERVQSHEWLDTWKSDPGNWVESLYPQIFASATNWAKRYEQQAVQGAAHPAEPTAVAQPIVANEEVEKRLHNLELGQRRVEDWIRKY